MNKRLSADPIALILGICSLLIVFLGCCCGVFVVVALALSIVGLILANKSLREYDNAPEQYSFNSKNNVFIAKVLTIIGVIVSSIALLVVVILFAIYGTILSSSLMQEIYKKDRNRLERLEKSIDSMNYDYEVESDSLYTDTIKVESETE